MRTELTARGTDAGAHTIRWHLQQETATPLPAASTIHRILAANGHVTPQPQKRPRSSWIRFQADQPNETWQLDYSDHYLADHRRINVVTIFYDHSRFIFACESFNQATVINNGRAFTTSINPTANSGNGFEQLLLELGIQRKNGKPYHPQTQGKVERFHFTLRKALSARKPAATLADFNAQLTEVNNYYNHRPPHRALGRSTPHSAYQALPKATPSKLSTRLDHRLRVDKVGKTGKVTLRWKGQLRHLYIGGKFAGEPIALVCIDDSVTALTTATGTQIGSYILDPAVLYHRNLLHPDKRIKPTKK